MRKANWTDPRAILGAAIACVAWTVSLLVWRATRLPGLALSIFGLGVSLGPCLAAYRLARPARKQAWRQAAMAAGGGGILAFSLIDGVGLDVEAFFTLLLLGTMGAAIGHTIATTIAGPLLFGRILCGWGCWRAMVLEHLPVGTGAGRRRTGWWATTPFIGLAAAACVAAVCAFVLGIDLGGIPGRRAGSAVHVLVGVLVYYALSVALAFGLHDQRAFCKYRCPGGLILRWTSRRSLIAIRSRAELCTRCGACDRVCPMDVPVMQRAKDGGRVARGDCILCQRCVVACASGALRMGTKRSTTRA